MTSVDTSTPPSEYTPAQLAADLAAICDAHPDRVNPADEDGVCFYWQHQPDGVARCLIGEWLHQRGHPDPDADADVARDVLPTYGYPDDVAKLATLVQEVADGGGYGAAPARWADVHPAT